MACFRPTVSTIDDNFEEVCTKWFNEANSDISDDYVDEEYCINSDHFTDGEQEMSENEAEHDPETISSEDEEESVNSNNYYYGKNRFKWSKKEPTRNVCIGTHNIIVLPSMRSHSESSVYYFNKMFSPDMYSLVVKRTNEKLATFRPKYNKEQSWQIPTK